MKKCFAVAAAAFAMGLTVVSTARAQGNAGGFHFGLSALKYDTSYKTDAGESKDNRTILDWKVGYLASNQIYFGGNYHTYSGNTNTESPSRTATGLTIGYHNDGLFADLSYFLASEYKTSGVTTLKEGSGFGLEFGYNVIVSSNFYVGTELAYKTLTYKKIKSGLTETTSTTTITELAPLLNLGFYF